MYTRDIARERSRLGGDWAIAGVILTARMREIARFYSSSIDLTNKHLKRIKNVIFRRELGKDLEIIMLEMSMEEQEERVRQRHEGNQNAVDVLKVFISTFLILAHQNSAILSSSWNLVFGL